jgi:RNA polymerase sigma-70 factor (ECF subfamily)
VWVPGPRDVEDEFREFVTERSKALLRTAYLLAGDWATAEDLLQISLTKTFLAWKRLGHLDAVEPYTRKVLVNTATSWWRRRWHGEKPTEVLPERVSPDGLDERLERDALWRYVRTLPARQRAVLVLRFYEDQSEAETARVLGVSVGTVKSQCSRALATLRRRLSEQGIEPAGLPGGRSVAVGGDPPESESKPEPKPKPKPTRINGGPRPAPVMDGKDTTGGAVPRDIPQQRVAGVMASAEQGQS